ncbi:EamA family transporter [Candidatus Micrarchaeota archaeon]|jgi:uncharacterized membrane protein|nr:EamA family transporter [Candidatus Micrarchaeota archaeon]
MFLEAIAAMLFFSISTILLKQISSLNITQIFSPPNLYYALGICFFSLLGFAFSFFAMKEGKSAIVAAIISSAPAVVLILSIFLLGQTYNYKQIIGIIIIIFGLIFLVI